MEEAACYRTQSVHAPVGGLETHASKVTAGYNDGCNSKSPSHAVNYQLLVAVAVPTVLVALCILITALMIRGIIKRRKKLKDKGNRLECRGPT